MDRPRPCPAGTLDSYYINSIGQVNHASSLNPYTFSFPFPTTRSLECVVVWRIEASPGWTLRSIDVQERRIGNGNGNGNGKNGGREFTLFQRVEPAIHLHASCGHIAFNCKAGTTYPMSEAI